MTLNFKVGDTVKANHKYVSTVLEEISSPNPTLLQTIHHLKLMAEDTAKIQDIGYVTIEGVFHTAIHIMINSPGNSLFRGGRGTRIYFKHEDEINNSFLNC